MSIKIDLNTEKQKQIKTGHSPSVAHFPQTQLHTLNPKFLCPPLSKAAEGIVEYGCCSQSVTASFFCSIMGPLYRLQSFSKSLFWHGSSPQTTSFRKTCTCSWLCSLQGKHLAPAPEAIPPSPSSLTLVLRGRFHLLPHSSLPCSILPFLMNTSTEVPQLH